MTNDPIKTKALELLSEIVKEHDAYLMDKLRHARFMRTRERAHAELRTLGELASVLEGKIARERRTGDK